MNQSRRLRLSKLSLGLVVALAAAPAFAQSTSAGVGGLVTDNGGQPVAGAEVTITHVESGTVSRATTDASGRYTARGLRVGGPYEILITKAGTGTKTIEPPTSATAFGAAVSLANLTIASTSTALTVGKSTNTSAITLPVATSIAGPITVYGGDVTNSANLTATTANGSIAINASGTFTNSAAISSAAGNQTTIIKAQKAAITGSINSGTAATQITGFNAARTINLGITNDTTDTLSLSDTELDTITSGVIRVGDSTSGNMTVSAAISIASANGMRGNGTLGTTTSMSNRRLIMASVLQLRGAGPRPRKWVGSSSRCCVCD